MDTTKQLYEAAKAASGAKSDYEFAKRLGVTRSAERAPWKKFT